MTSQWWSWGLAGLGVLALWVIGSGAAWGWALGVFQQLLWVTYAVVTRQWGFIVSAAAFAATYLRGWYRRRDELRVQEALTAVFLEEDERVGGYPSGRTPASAPPLPAGPRVTRERFDDLTAAGPWAHAPGCRAWEWGPCTCPPPASRG